MKVILKRYNNIDGYEGGVDHLCVSICASIREALDHAKEIIKIKKDSADFVGFRIYSTRGELKHKLHNL